MRKQLLQNVNNAGSKWRVYGYSEYFFQLFCEKFHSKKPEKQRILTGS